MTQKLDFLNDRQLFFYDFLSFLTKKGTTMLEYEQADRNIIINWQSELFMHKINEIQTEIEDNQLKAKKLNLDINQLKLDWNEIRFLYFNINLNDFKFQEIVKMYSRIYEIGLKITRLSIKLNTFMKFQEMEIFFFGTSSFEDEKKTLNNKKISKKDYIKIQEKLLNFYEDKKDKENEEIIN